MTRIFGPIFCDVFRNMFLASASGYEFLMQLLEHIMNFDINKW